MNNCEQCREFISAAYRVELARADGSDDGFDNLYVALDKLTEVFESAIGCRKPLDKQTGSYVQ